MPVVLVHGVPETPAIWEPLIPELGRDDIVALQLPGFGCPRPEGFGATKEDYVAWLIGALEQLPADGPIDLVGHDWGGGLTVRLVSTRPDLVRSWVIDTGGIGDVEFEWHDFAKIWQTPDAGEQFFDQQLATDRAGTPMEHLDRTMADCILALYRSAVDVGKEWGPDFRDIKAPGLILIPTNDPFLSVESARRGAKSSGAQVAELEGLGHWWMTEDPAAGAAVLQRFWAGLA